MRPIFIVSTGRAGSMMLARVLARHPGVLALHEPVPHLNTEGYARWSGATSRAELLENIRKKRDRLVLQSVENRILYVESSHYCSHLIEELHALYGARFVHLHRDGRDFVRSALARTWWYPDYTGMRGRLVRVKHGLEAWLRRRYLLDVGSSWHDHRLSPPAGLETRFEKIAWLWSEINRVILDTFVQLPQGATLRFSLDEMNPRGLNRLLRFMDVESSPELIGEMLEVAARKPNRTSHAAVPDLASWTPHQWERFWQLAGPMMERLEYAPTRAPAPARPRPEAQPDAAQLPIGHAS